MQNLKSQTAIVRSRVATSPASTAPQSTDVRHPVQVLVLLCAAQLMLVLDFSIVNVALPSIGRDLQLAPSGLQWVVTAYALTFGGFLLVGGRAADLFGRRRMFIAGLVVFTFGSLLGGFASRAWMLIAARALQGFGGAAIAPAILSFITTTFPEGHARHRAMSWLGSMGTVGFAVGMVLGGQLTSRLGWPWVMFVNVPAGIVVIGAGMQLLPHGVERAARRGIHFGSAVLVTGAATSLVYAVTQVSTTGLFSVWALVPLAAAVGMGVFFLVMQQRLAAPLIPPSFFQNRSLLGANVAAALLTSAAPCMVFLLSLYLQQVLRWDPQHTGFAFIPQAVMGFTATRVVSRLVGRYSARRIIQVGGALLCCGLLNYLRLSADTTYLAGILPGMLIAPVGVLLGSISCTIVATTGVPREEQGLAAGMLATCQQLGQAIGLATVVSVIGLSSEGSPADQFDVDNFMRMVPYGFLTAAIFAAAASLVGSLVIRRASADVPDEELLAAAAASLQD